MEEKVSVHTHTHTHARARARACVCVCVCNTTALQYYIKLDEPYTYMCTFLELSSKDII